MSPTIRSSGALRPRAHSVGPNRGELAQELHADVSSALLARSTAICVIDQIAALGLRRPHHRSRRYGAAHRTPSRVGACAATILTTRRTRATTRCSLTSPRPGRSCGQEPPRQRQRRARRHGFHPRHRRPTFAAASVGSWRSSFAWTPHFSRHRSSAALSPRLPLRHQGPLLALAPASARSSPRRSAGQRFSPGIDCLRDRAADRAVGAHRCASSSTESGSITKPPRTSSSISSLPTTATFEYSAVTTNQPLSRASALWDFMAGRGAQEKTFAELKNDFAFDVIPTNHYGANSAWQQLSILAHNLMRALQFDASSPSKPRPAKRTAVYRLLTMKYSPLPPHRSRGSPRSHRRSSAPSLRSKPFNPDPL